MDFRLDDSQLELQQTVERFCVDRIPLDGIGAREDRPTDRSTWTAMAELGVFGLLLGEAAGGSGLGAVEGAIVFEQLGSFLAPGPVLWTVLAAPFVEGAAGGATVVGGIEAGALDDDGGALVEHAADLDVLVVLGDDGIVVQRTADLDEPTPLVPLDPLTPVGRLTGLGRGAAVGTAEDAAEVRAVGTVLSAALLVGVASRALDVARDHALEREQFGVPIGSFQAIKHMLADMYVRSGLAQSATYAAAAVVEEDSRGVEAARAGAEAKLLAAEAAIANASAAVQVLGGMGFTWEMLPNHLVKRAWVLEQTFGRADDHALRLGTELLAEVS